MGESIFQIAEQINQLHKKAYDIYLPLVDDVGRGKQMIVLQDISKRSNR